MIRSSFIREYSEQRERMSNFGRELIAERNKLHRALNEEFGYSDPDGSFGIGCKGYGDKEYKRRYDEVEARFRKPYDQNRPAFNDWCRSRGMTVFEFLFFHNIYDEHLREIAAKSPNQDDWQLQPIQDKASRIDGYTLFQPIQVKAGLLVRKLKADHYVGGIRKRLDMEIADQRYANSGCRKFFSLKPWDLSAQIDILTYTREWKDALNRAFDRMTAA